jgi:GT2 family glycosyltransferase
LKVVARGKAFLLDGSPFRFRAVRYAPVPGPADAALDRLGADLAAIAACDYTVVSLAAMPGPVIQRAVDSGLRFILELECPELHSVASFGRRERRRLVRELAMRARRSARQWDRDDALLGVALSLPPAVNRSPQSAEVARRAADELAAALHDEHNGLLVSWQSSSEHDRECPPEFDYLIAALQLRRRRDLAAALLDCHCHVGDRPLVLRDVSVAGTDNVDEADRAWMIDTALRCGVGGIVAPPTAERPGKDALAAQLNRRTVRDLDIDWPAMSVVVNTYNDEQTLDECLTHCDRLDYPKLEVIVVDDGSSDATPAIARAHPRAQLVSIPHSGLPTARNVGYEHASGELVVYLDADAYPSLDWPWYLALATIGERIGGSGGPNVPPPDLPASAQIAARSPGSPTPQLLGPDRAKHVPGCNMAFWRPVLDELGGFDALLEGAEDLELEWRLVESGYEIGYHPAALVWHRRRPGLTRYLRQQRNYGRHYALLEWRYPERFPRGYRLRNAARRLSPRRSAAQTSNACVVRYLTLPRSESPVVELAHQWGMPVAVVLVCAAPLGLVRPKLAVPTAAAAAFVGALFTIDVVAAGRGRRRAQRMLRLRVAAATFRLLRPLAFRWGHLDGWRDRRRTARARRPA